MTDQDIPLSKKKLRKLRGDELLRNFGWTILRRPKRGEAQWISEDGRIEVASVVAEEIRRFLDDK